jgi:4-hydroxy-tetrahydrodipicolinate synthase
MSNGQKCKLHGVIPAICTPMNEDGSINYALLEKQADYLIEAGVNGLFVCGGTGEGAYLTSQEKKQVYKTVRAVAEKKVFVCLAVINSNTPATLAEMDFLNDCDADFIVSTAPFYHGADQRVIREHFKEVFAHANAPVIIYNIPSATHNPIDLDTICALSEMDNVAGVKDSSGNFVQFSRGLFGTRNSALFAWIQGEDYLCGPSLLCGGDGMVTGLGNAKVEPYVEMYRAYEAGDNDTIKKCQAKINFMYKIIHGAGYGNGNGAIKAVTELNGRGSRWMREKALTLDDQKCADIAKIMEAYESV